MTLTDRAFRWKPGPREFDEAEIEVALEPVLKEMLGQDVVRTGWSDRPLTIELDWNHQNGHFITQKGYLSLVRNPHVHEHCMLQQWLMIGHWYTTLLQKDIIDSGTGQGGSLDGLHREWTQALLGFGGGMTVVWSKVFLPRKTLCNVEIWLTQRKPWNYNPTPRRVQLPVY